MELQTMFTMCQKAMGARGSIIDLFAAETASGMAWFLNSFVLFFFLLFYFIFFTVCGPVWLSGRELRQQRKRLWVRFPGNTCTNEKCMTWMQLYAIVRMQSLEKSVC